MKQNLKVNLVWLGLLVAGFALIQVLVETGVLNLFYIQILEQIGINIILAVGLNLIVGFSGQFSLGHAGFMAIGAYSAAILGSKSPTYGAFFGAMVLGALIAGVVALIVGVPTLRLKGDYLAIATLGVSEIIRILIVNGGTLTNGAAGILGLPAFTTWQLVYLFVVITTSYAVQLDALPFLFVKMKSQQNLLGSIRPKSKSSPLYLVRSQRRLLDLSKLALLAPLFLKIILSPILLMS